MERLGKYIISINRNTGLITLADFNQNNTWFCEYSKTYSKADYDKIKVGQYVVDDGVEILILNEIQNRRVLHLLKNYKAERLLLEEKYSINNLDASSLTNARVPMLKEVLDDYFMKRVTEGKDTNLFIADATYLFCKAMGLKVKAQGDADPYNRLGFTYPEDIHEIAEAIYSYIEEKLITNPITKSITFYEFGSKENTLEYNNLKIWLEQNTHFIRTRFKSSVSMRMKVFDSNGETKKSETIANHISKIFISPNTIEYHHDGTLKNHIVTRVTDTERDSIGFSWSFTVSKGQLERKIG